MATGITWHRHVKLDGFYPNYFTLHHYGAHCLEHAHAQRHLIEADGFILVAARGTPGGDFTRLCQPLEGFSAAADVRHLVINIEQRPVRVRCLFNSEPVGRPDRLVDESAETPIEDLSPVIREAMRLAHAWMKEAGLA